MARGQKPVRDHVRRTLPDDVKNASGHKISDSLSRPSDDTPRIKVQNNSQIEPTLTGPDITDINDPFLIAPICQKVTVQQIWRNIELVIAVRRDLVFMPLSGMLRIPCRSKVSDDRYAVLAHQSADTTVADIQTKLLQLFGHSGATVTVQTQPVLFPDMGQQDQILALTSTRRARPPGALLGDANITCQPMDSHEG